MPALKPNKQNWTNMRAACSGQTNPHSDQWDPKQKLFSYMILPSEAQPYDLDLHEVHVKTTERSLLTELCLYKKMLENRPLKLKNNANSFSDIFHSELNSNWASHVVFVKTDDARTMPGCRTPFSFSLVYLLCVKSSPKPLFSGWTLSKCGENIVYLWGEQLSFCTANSRPKTGDRMNEWKNERQRWV